MTRPKEHLPGQLAEICRRCTHRTYFWRPGADTRNLFGYMYGKAVNDHGQIPHVVCLMSNHTHMLQTDVPGTRSDFMQQLFSNATRKRNLQLDRSENIWEVKAPGDMTVLDIEEIIERVLYVCLQPVAAGCVETVEEWTGFQILPRHWGKTMTFKRPEQCGKDMPKKVEFIPMPPPGFDHLPLKQVIAFFEDLIAEREKEYKKNRTGTVEGIASCEATSPFYSPDSESPKGGLNPRWCTSNPKKLIRALEHQKQRLNSYRKSLDSFRKGNRNVVFPAGTLQMERRSGVACSACVAGHPMLTDSNWTSGVQARWNDWRLKRMRRGRKV